MRIPATASPSMRQGQPVANPANPGVADSLGSLIIRNLRPGRAYQWLDDSSGRRSQAFAVLAPGQNPATDSALYAQPAHARRAQLRHDARRHHTRRDGSLPIRPDLFGEQSVPHGHRVLRLQRRGPDRPHPAADRRRVGGTMQFLRKPEPSSGLLDRRRRRRRTRLGVCHGQPADAWHRVLRWCVRPLRIPVRLRRLRRHRDRRPPGVGRKPQGRHGRDQLLGALAVPRCRDRSARARGHCAFESDGRSLLDGISRWDLQQRVRR